MRPSTKKAAKLRPIDARTLKQVCKLPRDNLNTVGHWILLDGIHVVLCAQVLGEPATQTMRIPRSEFARMARWYVTGRASK